MDSGRREDRSGQHGEQSQGAIPSRSILNGWDVVCFASDWDGDPLSKKHLMRLASKEARVLWVNSFGNRAPKPTSKDIKRMWTKLRGFVTQRLSAVERNIYVLNPMALPLFNSPLASRLNSILLSRQVRKAMETLQFGPSLVWSFAPSSSVVVGKLGEKAILYHCVDEFSAFEGAPKTSIVAMEKELAGKSHLVVCCSDPLYRRKLDLNPNTHLVRHGVEVAHFGQALSQSTQVPKDLDAISKPRIGFFGLIAEWIDLNLVKASAELLPHVSFVFIGKSNVDTTDVERCPNVHFLGHRPYDLLPAYAKGFDVAMLPFVRNELADNSNPLKLREYLAAGLPVVSTGIPEAMTLSPPIAIADSPQQFAQAIERCLLDNPGPCSQRAATVASDTWENTYRTIMDHLSPILASER